MLQIKMAAGESRGNRFRFSILTSSAPFRQFPGEKSAHFRHPDAYLNCPHAAECSTDSGVKNRGGPRRIFPFPVAFSRPTGILRRILTSVKRKRVGKDFGRFSGRYVAERGKLKEARGKIEAARTQPVLSSDVERTALKRGTVRAKTFS